MQRQKALRYVSVFVLFLLMPALVTASHTRIMALAAMPPAHAPELWSRMPALLRFKAPAQTCVGLSCKLSWPVSLSMAAAAVWASQGHLSRLLGRLSGLLDRAVHTGHPWLFLQACQLHTI